MIIGKVGSAVNILHQAGQGCSNGVLPSRSIGPGLLREMPIAEWGGEGQRAEMT